MVGPQFLACRLGDPAKAGFSGMGVGADLIYLYGYRINLEKELALYLYVLCWAMQSYMIKSKYWKITKITQPRTLFYHVFLTST